MLDEIESKTCTKLKKVIERRKGSKAQSEVKSVENINKNLQSFLEISPVQKGSPFFTQTARPCI